MTSMENYTWVQFRFISAYMYAIIVQVTIYLGCYYGRSIPLMTTQLHQGAPMSLQEPLLHSTAAPR